MSKKFNPFTNKLDYIGGAVAEPIEYAYMQKSGSNSTVEFQNITHTNTNNWDAVSPNSTRIDMSSPNTMESSANISINNYGFTINKSSRYEIVATINGIWDDVPNDWMQIVKGGTTAITWGQFRASGGNEDGIAMTLNWQGNLSSGDTIDIRVNGTNTNVTNIASVSISIAEIPTTANITIEASANEISDLDNDTGVYTELSADSDEIFMKAKGKTAMTLNGAGSGVITKIKDGTNDRISITTTVSNFLSPDNTTAIVIDNNNINAILEGKTVISLNNSGYNNLHSPDGTKDIAISNDSFRIRQSGKNRFYSDSIFSYIQSPDTDTNISVENDVAQIDVNGITRIRIDNTSSYLKSPDEDTYIKVRDTGIIHNGYTKLGSNAVNIQQKYFSGTTGTGSTTIVHGLTGSKILSVDVSVETSFGGFYTPASVDSVFVQYYVRYWNSTDIELSSQGSAIDGRPYKILITYEE